MATCFSGFLVINAVWLYISGGQWISFQPSGYWRDLFQPLGETFLTPLSVITHKWMIAVDGLALGLMIFVPIILSVLYRLVWAAPAVAIMALVGHAPVLAATLALGCMLASRTWLRSDMPFVAFLLGLLPPGLYLMLFSSMGGESAALPVEQLLLKAPLLAAIVTAVLSGVVVLAMARLTHYRSGVVWPVVAALVAGPMLLFFLLVGSDELEYNLMTGGLSPTDTLLEPLSLGQWRQRNGGADLPPKNLLPAVQRDLQSQKVQWMRQCERFMAGHPRSERAAAVLWVRAQMASLRVDAQALAGGQVKYDSSAVSGESAPSWALLAKEYDRRPQAALAQLHLAELALRDGRIPDALALMRDCDKKLSGILSRKRRESAPSPAELNPFAEAALVPRRVYYQLAQSQARQWLWIVQQVHAEQDAPSAAALQAWIKLNPAQADYAPQLGRLVELYDKTNMGDVLRLAMARVDDNMERRLKALAALGAKPTSPAYLWANFALGEELLNATTPRPGLKTAKDYFQVVADGGESPWKSLAAQRLIELAGAKE
jgi:hypothetical protein